MALLDYYMRGPPTLLPRTQQCVPVHAEDKRVFLWFMGPYYSRGPLLFYGRQEDSNYWVGWALLF